MSRIRISLLVWSSLAMIADGFDSAGLASAAPAMGKAWHLARSDFSLALSASLFGMLLGAPLLGHAGDRFGRKPLIIGSCLLFAVATFITAWSTCLWHLIALRLITGIGLAGIMPNLVALNAELAPQRLRSFLVVLMFTGISVGAGLPGIVQAWLIPEHGWQVMFWIGGCVPLVIAACLVFTLPESPTHSTASPASPGRGLAALFDGPLRYITPLLWLCVASALMANFFLNSWLPLLFDSFGMTAAQTGITTTLYHYSGIFGGLLVSLLLGRYGFIALGVVFLLAMPAIAAIGTPALEYGAIAAAATLAGFCTLGAQFGNIAASSLVYPTMIRATGVGWALGIGRLGSIAGPLVGGWLIARHMAPDRLFLLASVPMLAGAVGCAAIAVIRHRASHTIRLDG